MNFGTGNGGHDFEDAAIAAFLRSSSEEIAPAASDKEQITTEVADSSCTGDGSQESAAEAAAIAFLRSSSEERAPADSGKSVSPLRWKPMILLLTWTYPRNGFILQMKLQ